MRYVGSHTETNTQHVPLLCDYLGTTISRGTCRGRFILWSQRHVLLTLHLSSCVAARLWECPQGTSTLTLRNHPIPIFCIEDASVWAGGLGKSYVCALSNPHLSFIILTEVTVTFQNHPFHNPVLEGGTYQCAHGKYQLGTQQFPIDSIPNSLENSHSAFCASSQGMASVHSVMHSSILSNSLENSNSGALWASSQGMATVHSTFNSICSTSSMCIIETSVWEEDLKGLVTHHLLLTHKLVILILFGQC